MQNSCITNVASETYSEHKQFYTVLYRGINNFYIDLRLYSLNHNLAVIQAYLKLYITRDLLVLCILWIYSIKILSRIQDGTFLKKNSLKMFLFPSVLHNLYNTFIQNLGIFVTIFSYLYSELFRHIQKHWFTQHWHM